MAEVTSQMLRRISGHYCKDYKDLGVGTLGLDDLEVVRAVEDLSPQDNKRMERLYQVLLLWKSKNEDATTAKLFSLLKNDDNIPNKRLKEILNILNIDCSSTTPSETASNTDRGGAETSINQVPQISDHLIQNISKELAGEDWKGLFISGCGLSFNDIKAAEEAFNNHGKIDLICAELLQKWRENAQEEGMARRLQDIMKKQNINVRVWKMLDQEILR